MKKSDIQKSMKENNNNSSSSSDVACSRCVHSTAITQYDVWPGRVSGLAGPVFRLLGRAGRLLGQSHH